MLVFGRDEIWHVCTRRKRRGAGDNIGNNYMSFVYRINSTSLVKCLIIIAIKADLAGEIYIIIAWFS